MTHDGRRRFLRQLAGAAAAAFPPAIQAALSIPAARRTGTLQDVQHIVVLTQENRSFDHYFGTLAGVRGFGDPHPVPLPGGRTVFAQPMQGEPTRLLPPFHLNTQQDFAALRATGTPHTWPDAQAAWDHGRMAHWPWAKRNHAMGHYREADIPFQFALAQAFTLCDHYHCATQTGTNTNRLFLWSGHNDPFAMAGGPATDNSRAEFSPDRNTDYRWTTYVERLQAAGIAWQVYQDMADNFEDNPLAGFRPFRDGWYGRPGHDAALKARGIATRDLDMLQADVLAGRLPQVSWIVATAEGSEHPGPSSPASGADYIARVLQALTANPEVWSRTVLLINFDENDGFFDHMPPPAVPSYLPQDPAAIVPGRSPRAGASTVDTAGEYHHRLDDGSDPHYQHRPYGLGPRVPLYVISPWSRGGWVNSQVADHTSVLRFIEARFGVREPLISPWRRTVCGDLTSCFDFRNPERAATAWITSLPATQNRRQRAQQFEKTQLPTIPDSPRLPEQPHASRPARPLPYDLQVQAQLQPQSGAMRLLFQNPGKAGAVFHVYDRLNLQAVPRRYTVEAGNTLQDDWRAAGDARHDLWVLGPNGFHRHYMGRSDATDAPLVEAHADAASGELLLRLTNPGSSAVQVDLRPLRHAMPVAQELSLQPGETRLLRLPLAANGHWYDLGITSAAWPGFGCRLAGHVETGQPSVSDPAMGGACRLQSDWA